MSESDADGSSEIDPDKPPETVAAGRPRSQQAGRRLARVAAFAAVRGAGTAIGSAFVAAVILWWQRR
ncbi:hypothetical protein ACFWXK_01705 [Streptomyces sp. NPDC059070]|uniref:hypothetical protein n=1 Tax=Streptomyces sp. NPDC059070 TaxID=3346713 RepID=UPI0036CFA1CF